MEKKLEKTKDLLLDEALKLFAQKGYDSVSVANIAEAVNCTPAALYKHYESKQALFDALIEKSKKEFSTRMDSMNVDFYISPEKRKEFVKKNEEEQIEIFMQFFIRTLDDEFPCLFRKLLTVEQYNHPELAEIYNQRYVYFQAASLEALLQEFIDAGIMKDYNAHDMAIQLYAPGILYITMCDRSPSKRDEILKALEQQLRHFFKVYKK